MAIARIYAPLTGYVSNTDPFACCSCNHTACSGGQYLTDIGAAQYATLYLHANGEIRSFFVEHQFTCAPNCADDLRRAVKIRLYNSLNYCCEIGWIVFGHVKNALATGGYNYTPSGIVIGNVPPNPGNCSNYTGSHSHMEAKTYSGVTLTRGSTIACNNQVVKGSTTVYNWSFNPATYCPLC